VARDRSRFRDSTAVIGREDRHLPPVPQAATRVQLLDGEANAPKLVEPLRCLLAALWAFDGDQQWRPRIPAALAASETQAPTITKQSVNLQTAIASGPSSKSSPNLHRLASTS
jgi:hypothetical protein